MAEYLSPNGTNLSIQDKKDLYSIRNKIINIEGNYSSKYTNTLCTAGCIDIETTEHIYTCIILNTTNIEIPFKNIYNGSNMSNKKY